MLTLYIYIYDDIYIYIYDDEHSLKLNVVVGVKTIKLRVLMPENRGVVQTRRFLNMPT